MDEYLDYISNNRESLINSGKNLVCEFTVRINDWEREQRHFPNPADDVPYIRLFFELLRVALRKSGCRPN